MSTPSQASVYVFFTHEQHGTQFLQSASVLQDRVVASTMREQNVPLALQKEAFAVPETCPQTIDPISLHAESLYMAPNDAPCR